MPINLRVTSGCQYQEKFVQALGRLGTIYGPWGKPLETESIVMEKDKVPRGVISTSLYLLGLLRRLFQ